MSTWLTTERLRLRPITMDDVDRWVELHADPHVSTFLSSYTPERARERIAMIEEQWRTRGHGLCAVELASTGEFIGRAGLQHWAEFDEVETAWTIASAQWGKGYATEAARAAVEWGFANLDRDYFTAMIHSGNDASVRVAERLGYRVLREDTFGGKPVTVYAIHRPS